MLPDAMPVMMHLRNVRREHHEAVKASLMVCLLAWSGGNYYLNFVSLLTSKNTDSNCFNFNGEKLKINQKSRKRRYTKVIHHIE